MAMSPVTDRAVSTGDRTTRGQSYRRPSRAGKGRSSRLIWRIIAINLFPLVPLFWYLSYLDRYQNSLIEAELRTLSYQATTLAESMGAFAVGRGRRGNLKLLDRQTKHIVRRSADGVDARILVFDRNFEIIADSFQSGRLQVRRQSLPPPSFDAELIFAEIWNHIANWLLRRAAMPPYRNQTQHRDIVRALDGHTVKTTEATESGELKLRVTIPVKRYKRVVGALVLLIDGTVIDENLRSIRGQIHMLLLIVLVIALGLSIYLAGTITRPIQRLAAAAERVRTGRNRQHLIPDLSNRKDEIGDLARALGEMTENLWQRMDETGKLAADVSHEFKNPLASIRSAAETAMGVEDPVQRKAMIEIILNDVRRLDRLISDTAEASKVDSELSLQETMPVHIGRLVATVCDIYIQTDRVAAGDLTVGIVGDASDKMVNGHEDRLAQVFRNLIDNAITFTRRPGKIAIRVDTVGANVIVTVDDDGIGIPIEDLEKIFNRFYSGRPKTETFGAHSGLGLSISRKIVEAHDGSITAENRHANDGIVCGARFVVVLPRAMDGADGGVAVPD